jgi:hypothetical protein
MSRVISKKVQDLLAEWINPVMEDFKYCKNKKDNIYMAASLIPTRLKQWGKCACPS